MDAEPTDMEPDGMEGQLYHGCLKHAQILLSIGGPGTSSSAHTEGALFKRHREEFYGRYENEIRSLLCSAFPLRSAIRREGVFSQASTCPSAFPVSS